MEVKISYTPHQKQLEVHRDLSRFRVIAAGRRSGKTTLAVNELIKEALSHPQTKEITTQRSWYICETYRQAEMIAWREVLRYLPEQLIKTRNVNKLFIELVNGHIIEFKGAEEPDRLRGVALNFVIFDEYGKMLPEVWTDVIRATLMDTKGRALFIGTPSADGSPHFHELFKLGQSGDPAYHSWLFFTKDNPKVEIQEDVIQAKRELPEDVYKREYEADFAISGGLIYDNFKFGIHVIPNYTPDSFDLVVGSIDPGLHNPTAAVLIAWDREGVGRVFYEYYQSGKLAGENADEIRSQTRSYKVAYWIIDRSSKRREHATGLTVYDKFAQVLKPLVTAANDPGSVWAGIDEVKKLFHIDPVTNKPKLYVCHNMHKTLWEIGRYSRDKYKWFVDKNAKEAPRKLNDHAMDCIRNMVATRPWVRRSVRYMTLVPGGTGYDTRAFNEEDLKNEKLAESF